MRPPTLTTDLDVQDGTRAERSRWPIPEALAHPRASGVRAVSGLRKDFSVFSDPGFLSAFGATLALFGVMTAILLYVTA